MMDEIFDLDLQHLHEISGDDPSFEIEIVEEYITDAWKLCSNMREAIAEQHSEEVVMLAHTLKGSSRSVGALHVAASCEKLETECRNGSGTTLEVLLGDVETRLRRLSQTYGDALRRAA